jgi:Fur family ferric uptake transcriptional regulator
MNCKQHAQFFKTQLHKNNLKATPGRLALLDVFEHARKPLNIQEIISAFRLGGEADTATIYRNIEALKELGVLVQVDFRERAASYELASKGHHHHAVCEKCGKVSDIEKCSIGSLEKLILKHGSFASINSHSLEFFGICNTCAV